MPGTVGARVADHRAQRRDAGSAGDEQELLFGGIVGKGERPRGPAREGAGRGAAARSALPIRRGVDLDEEFDGAVLGGIFGRGGDGVGDEVGVRSGPISATCPAR